MKISFVFFYVPFDEPIEENKFISFDLSSF
jgi:hypothetical protein